MPGGHDFVGLRFASVVPAGRAVLTLDYDGAIDRVETAGIFKQQDGDAWYAFWGATLDEEITQYLSEIADALPFVASEGFHDAWTVGYTPSYSTAVWVGTDDNSPIKTAGGRPVYGRMLPGSMWQQFMSGATRNKPREPFSKLVPITDVRTVDDLARAYQIGLSSEAVPPLAPDAGFEAARQRGTRRRVRPP